MTGDRVFPLPTSVGDPDTVVRDAMFRRRMVMVRGELDAALASRTVAELFTLDAVADAPIDLHLDVGGADLDATFAVIDAIDTVTAPVRVRLVGRAAGVAFAVLAVGDERVVTPYARAAVGEPSTSFDGRPDAVVGQADAFAARVADLAGRVADASGRTRDEIHQLITESVVMDAESLVALGIADRIDVP